MAIPRQSLELTLRELLALVRSFRRSPSSRGEGVRQFETALGRYVGARHAVSFGSQRAGMYEVLRTIPAKGDSEVIVPAYTFFSVPASVLLAGLRPVFVDVDPNHWNLDPARVRAAITSKTRAMIVTHLNGCPAEMDALAKIAGENHLILIEDCAQSLGARVGNRQVGSFGAGCFSFGEGKNLYALGGGLVTTDDDTLASRLRESQVKRQPPPFSEILVKSVKALAMRTLTFPPVFTVTAYPAIYLSTLRNGAVDTESEHRLKDIPEASLYSGFSDAQAALGLAQLENLESRNRKRIENAHFLSEALRGLDGITLPPEPGDRTDLYLHYAVVVKDREAFVRRLVRNSVDAQRDYCSFCPALPDFKAYAPPAEKTPVASSLAGRIAYLPNQPSLKRSTMLRIAEQVRKVLGP